MDTATKGVYAASLTPLTSKLEPDIPELIDHVLWLIDSGANGVAILGSTGEANSLTLDQRLRIIKNSAKKLPEKKILIGTGCCAIQDTIKLTRACFDAGIFSVLVLPPFYYKPLSDNSVLRYFSELICILNEPRLRIIFYNFPKLSGYNFSTKILNELKKQFGKIASGIKDSSGDWGNIKNFVRNVPDFKVYAGTETFLLNTLNEGGNGCISATANLTVRECQKVYLAWKNKNIKKSIEAQNYLSNIRKILEKHSFVPELKCLFAENYTAGNWKSMLPPFYPLLGEQVHSIQNQLEEIGLDLELCLRKK